MSSDSSSTMAGGLMCRRNMPVLSDLSDLDDDMNLLQALPKTPAVSVKNTFIQDIEGDDSDDDLPPMLAMQSCPVLPRLRDEPLKVHVAGIQTSLRHARAHKEEEEDDLTLPMRICKTYSDFSQCSVATAGPLLQADVAEYDFDCSPTSGLGEWTPCKRSEGAASGLDFEVGPAGRTPCPFMGRSRSPFMRGFDQIDIPTPKVTVKNTFISGWTEDDDEIDGMPFVATQSCPAPSLLPQQLQEVSRSNSFFGGVNPFFLNGAAQQMPLQASAVGLPVPVCLQPQSALLGLLCALPEPQRQPSSESEHASEATTQASATVVLPLDVRQPEWSQGSAPHETGECKPCAWFWRPQGCLNGVECRHCHLCPLSAIKARRKAKQGKKQQQQ